MASEHTALNILRGEILCPFCRTVSNSLLPNFPDVSFPFQNKTVLDTTHPLLYMRMLSEGRASSLDLFRNNDTNTEYKQSIQQRNEFFLRCLSQCAFVDGSDSVQTYLKSFAGSEMGKVHGSLKDVHLELQCVYATWSSVAYTLQMATVNQIRSRNQGLE